MNYIIAKTLKKIDTLKYVNILTSIKINNTRFIIPIIKHWDTPCLICLRNG